MNKFRQRVAIALLTALLPVASWAGPVDINTADAESLARELDGIGLARAQAIVEYRDKHGPFKAPEDLKRVSGVGEKVFERNRGNIIVGKPEAVSAGKK